MPAQDDKIGDSVRGSWALKISAKILQLYNVM